MSEISRRQENRAISCLLCGASLGIYVEGGRVPASDHRCLEYGEVEEQEAERLAGGGKGPDD